MAHYTARGYRRASHMHPPLAAIDRHVGSKASQCQAFVALPMNDVPFIRFFISFTIASKKKNLKTDPKMELVITCRFVRELCVYSIVSA